MKLFRKEKFTFIGDRETLRSDEEMALIDKKEADSAFKKCKKEIIDELLLHNNFCKWTTNAYVRLNEIGLLEYINLQKERYGSKTFCVNFAAMPLYCGESYMRCGLGDRLGSYISGGKDVWWDYCSEAVAEQSFQNVAEAITQFIFPWFQELSSEESYRKRLIKDKSKRFAGYPAEKWFVALQIENKEQLIQNGIEQLGLPKKIMDKKI